MVNFRKDATRKILDVYFGQTIGRRSNLIQDFPWCWRVSENTDDLLGKLRHILCIY